VYTEVALALFLGVFIAIAIHTFLPSRRRELDAASRIPLEDDVVRTPRTVER
jgi:cbb3-type cytochrome oxidase subunit 3